jgi:hypothetical protein
LKPKTAKIHAFLGINSTLISVEGLYTESDKSKRLEESEKLEKDETVEEATPSNFLTNLSKA